MTAPLKNIWPSDPILTTRQLRPVAVAIINTNELYGTVFRGVLLTPLRFLSFYIRFYHDRIIKLDILRAITNLDLSEPTPINSNTDLLSFLNEPLIDDA